MSLSPWYNDLLLSSRPSRILDQHFGVGLADDDSWSPFILPREVRSLMNWPQYYRPWRSFASEQDSGSTLKIDNEKFQVNLDVQQFTPNEIVIKTTGDNEIVIEGKHEEREDEHGFISRQFVRRYILPKGVDIGQVESKLSSDGILTITAPKIGEKTEYRNIPITQTGQPSKAKETKNLEKGDTK